MSDFLDKQSALLAYRALCRGIAEEIEDKSDCLKLSAKHAPAYHTLIIRDLEATKLICDRAIEEINKMHQIWRKAAQ